MARKTARALSAVVMTMVAIAALFALGWFAYAQEGATTPPQDAASSGVTQGASGSPVSSDLGLSAEAVQAMKTMRWDQATSLLDPLRDLARQAVKDGNASWAAAKFQGIAETLPTSPGSADAWFWAAIAHGKTGNSTAAIAACDNTVATCKQLLVIDYLNPPDYSKGLPYPDSLRDLMRRALRHKAELCRNAGQIQESMRAIEQFRAEEPEYSYLKKLLPLQAELQGVSAAGLEALEVEAWRLSDQAKWAWWNDHDANRACQLADQVIAQYPDSGGAALARGLKVKVLWRAKRYAEAKALSQEILNRLQAVAPSCELVRDASCRIAWLESTRILKELRGRKRQKQSIAAQDWEAIRDHCRTVMRWNKDVEQRSTMHMQMIESFAWEGRPADVLTEVARFLRQNQSAERMQIPAFKRMLAWAYLFRGRAYSDLKQYPEAKAAIRQAIAAYDNDPNGWELGGPLPSAYYSLWQTLRASGVAPKDARAAVAPLFEKMPRSHYAMLIISPMN